MLREYTVVSRYGYHSIEIVIMNRYTSAKFGKFLLGWEPNENGKYYSDPYIEEATVIGLANARAVARKIGEDARKKYDCIDEHGVCIRTLTK